MRVASGGRFQWVLDAACHAVEWLSQPLRFDSVVLRTSTRPIDSDVTIEIDRRRTNWQRYEPRMTTGAFGFW